MPYQPPNPVADLPGQPPDYPPRIYHIPVSQQHEVLALLAKQGFDVIPAGREDIQYFLTGNHFFKTRPLQLAAHPDMERPPQDECLPKRPAPDCPADCNTKGQTNDQDGPKACRRQPNPAPIPTLSKAAKTAVMLIVIGVVVIAALFIYAGKWIVDMIRNDEDYYSYWWDIGGQFINLDTDPGEHGSFTAIKFSGGFAANRLAQLGLAAEAGRMDLDLLHNRNSTAQRIKLEGAYWLLGPTVRWLLGYTDTERFVNNSYFYVELPGGSSDRNEVDLIAVRPAWIQHRPGQTPAPGAPLRRLLSRPRRGPGFCQ